MLPAGKGVRGGGGDSSRGLRIGRQFKAGFFLSRTKKKNHPKNLHIHEAWRGCETESMVALNTETHRVGEAWKFTCSPEEYVIRWMLTVEVIYLNF